MEIGKLLKLSGFEEDVMKKKKNLSFLDKFKQSLKEKSQEKQRKSDEIVNEKEKVLYEIDLDRMKTEKKHDFLQKNIEFMLFSLISLNNFLLFS